MSKSNTINVKEIAIRTIKVNGSDYICITDIAKQKNPIEPKDVVKNWMRLKNTLEYLGLWEVLNNPGFKGGEFDPLLKAAGINELICLSNMENLNAVFIAEKITQKERLIKLNQIAIQQMKILAEVENRKLLK